MWLPSNKTDSNAQPRSSVTKDSLQRYMASRSNGSCHRLAKKTICGSSAGIKALDKASTTGSSLNLDIYHQKFLSDIARDSMMMRPCIGLRRRLARAYPSPPVFKLAAKQYRAGVSRCGRDGLPDLSSALIRYAVLYDLVNEFGEV